ncbi:hypothetical protein P9265_01765 [Schinkia azotoformans]|uniref:hypothetical protein n=1 Tax=Schinkia azotoformans TaxID=1454 RepID=UPI002E23E619|nr:hypothetical protein [Schinkia azotoformans]
MKKIVLSLIILLSPLIILVFLLWIGNGFTFLTISQEDFFIDGKKMCITNECLKSHSNFHVNFDEETSYVIPFILDRVKYKEPYSFRYDVDHPEEWEVKDFKIIIKSEENEIENRAIIENEIQKKERNTAFFIEGIPFNTEIHDKINVYVEYVIVNGNIEKKQKEKIEFKVETKQEIGVRLWWNIMSI